MSKLNAAFRPALRRPEAGEPGPAPGALVFRRILVVRLVAVPDSPRETIVRPAANQILPFPRIDSPSSPP